MTGKETPQQTIDRLTAENAALTKQNEETKKLVAQAGADETIIAEKMAVGLTREQAVAATRRQREFDALNGAAASPAVA
jgi:hypothetical protein